jgi:hypothetical protein
LQLPRSLLVKTAQKVAGHRLARVAGNTC